MQFEPHHDFYKDIGVDLKGRTPKDVPLDEIKKAYRKLMKQYHPDKVRNLTELEQDAAIEIAKAATLAKEVLFDKPDLRESYHHFLATKNLRGAESSIFRGSAKAKSAGGAFNHSFDHLWRDFEKVERDFQQTMGEAEEMFLRHEADMARFAKRDKIVSGIELTLFGAAAVVALGAVIFSKKHRKNKDQQQLVNDVNNHAQYGTVDVRSM